MTSIKSKKAEMTLALVVAIVIGLVIMAIVIYMISGKSKDLASGTSCDASVCASAAEKCSSLSGLDASYEKSFTSCKKQGSDGNSVKGRCCVSE